jgi:chromosome segregation ATPase
LKQANIDAIQEYEAIRKERKRIKREKQMVEKQRQDVVGIAKKASMSGWQSHAGSFAGCY